MIDQPGIAKLRQFRDPHKSVLSIYLTVPLVPAQQREVSAYLEDLLRPLMQSAASQAGNSGGPAERAVAAARQADIEAVRASVAAHAPDWLGRTVAIFACRGLGLFEVIPLPGNVPSQAVLSSRPYIRPLLAAAARSPGYVAAVVDRTHAWLLRITADGIETAAQLEDEGLRSPGFSGWYGLEAWNVNQRVSELARRHYRKAAEALERARRAEDFALLVVAGHRQEVNAFFAALPRELRGRFAGSAVVDPRVMTPARVRAVTDEVVSRWVQERERKLVADLAAQPNNGLTVSGLAACVAAVNKRAVRLLLVPDDAVAAGWVCEQCGTLSVNGGECAVCRATPWHVSDIVEELIGKVLDDSGEVETVRADHGIGGLAAALRFPVGTQ